MTTRALPCLRVTEDTRDSGRATSSPTRLADVERFRTPDVPTILLRHFLNRELSWIDFNRRVLELPADATLLLLDRVRFCAIASSNLDEFFAVRMAELEEQAAAGRVRRAADGTPLRPSPVLVARLSPSRRLRTRSG
jgi:hypothetical protein